MNNTNSKKATAIYTGGGIYTYYAELTDGNWLMGCDDWIIIINTNPLVSEEAFEQSGYSEWQQEHLITYIPDEQLPKILMQLIDTIFEKHTIEKYDNYCITTI